MTSSSCESAKQQRCATFDTLQAAALRHFRHALATADEPINLDSGWSCYKSHQEAVNPSSVTAKRHCQVSYLDLDMNLHSPAVRNV